jgi:hypothetical protein
MANKMTLKGYDPEVVAGVSKLKNKEANKQTPEYVPMAAFTCRINLETSAALRRASVDRKVNRQNPASQQEIVQAALDSWLKENGYL